MYLKHWKSKPFEKFKEFKIEVEKQLDKIYKALRSNRGGKYLSSQFDKYLRDNEIVSQLIALGTP